MDWTLLPKTRRDAFFLLLVLAVPFVFFFVGLPAPSIAKDAAQYSAYATNMVTGHGYSIDGATFNNFREPGYPAFLAVIYLVFGVQNFFSVLFVQTILLGLLGYIVYRIFADVGEKWVGYGAGLVTSLLPPYGMYTHIIGSELVFAFFLGLTLSAVLYIIKHKGEVPWYWYVLFAIVYGSTAFVRLQFIFFLPFLILCYSCTWSFAFIKKMVLSGILVLCMFGSWAVYIHQHTGTFALTSGRQEVSLYIRADRAELSYTQLTHYAIDWVRRSVTGGQGTAFLNAHEYEQLGIQYSAVATSSAAIAATEKQNIATILSHPGHFAYGNLIEIMKTLYIEHDYSDSTNRYFRVGVYVLLYGLFLFGLVELIRKNDAPELKLIANLSLLFIIYNLAVLSFFDSIPRYNTPFLVFYLLVGFVGVALYRKRTRSMRAT